MEARSLVVAAVLFGVASLRGVLEPPPMRADALPPAPRLPMTIGQWKGAAQYVPAWLYEEIPASRIMSRVYKRGAGEQVYLYFITSSKPQAFHRSTICYPGQGWRIEGRRLVSLAHGRATAEAMLLNQKEVRVATLAWYESGGRVTPNVHIARLWVRLGGVSRKSAGPGQFVRVSAPIPEGPGGDERALSLLASFGNQVFSSYSHDTARNVYQDHRSDTVVQRSSGNVIPNEVKNLISYALPYSFSMRLFASLRLTTGRSLDRRSTEASR